VAVNAYEWGWTTCYADRCENVPFGYVGGEDARPDIKAPDCVPAHKRGAYMAGYRACARKLYGDDYLTCTFGWAPVLTIHPDGEVTTP
jgi:hypothetical protein